MNTTTDAHAELLALADSIEDSYSGNFIEDILLDEAERKKIVSALRRAATPADGMREALELAYHELKRHEADYHHQTSAEVNGKIVDALAALRPQPAREREAPASCPDCFDKSDCANVDICKAVEEVSPSVTGRDGK